MISKSEDRIEEEEVEVEVGEKEKGTEVVKQKFTNASSDVTQIEQKDMIFPNMRKIKRIQERTLNYQNFVDSQCDKGTTGELRNLFDLHKEECLNVSLNVDLFDNISKNKCVDTNIDKDKKGKIKAEAKGDREREGREAEESKERREEGREGEERKERRETEGEERKEGRETEGGESKEGGETEGEERKEKRETEGEESKEGKERGGEERKEGREEGREGEEEEKEEAERERESDENGVDVKITEESIERQDEEDIKGEMDEGNDREMKDDSSEGEGDYKKVIKKLKEIDNDFGQDDILPRNEKKELSSRSAFRFLFGGGSDEEIFKATEIVKLLGGSVISPINSKFDDSCTHLILWDMKRTEKYLCACAAGKVSTSFIFILFF